MSRVRYAVRFGNRILTWNSGRAFAHEYAQRVGGKVVRVTQYDAEETRARRAVIEAAKVWCANLDAEFSLGLLVYAVQALEVLERKEAAK